MVIQLGNGFSKFVRVKFDLPHHDKLQSELDVMKNSLSSCVVASNDYDNLLNCINEAETALWRLREGKAKAVRSMEDTCYFVLREYDLLFLPLFNKSTMMFPTGVYTRRSLGGFGHARVRDRLIRYSRRLDSGGKVVRIVSEAFSTKCCSGCSTYNPTIGARKAHQCRRNCGAKFWDRDSGSARSIFCRYIFQYINNFEDSGASAPSSGVGT